MSTIEVLVATMNQTDMRKYHEMNIRTDALFANQAAEHKYQEEMIGQHRVRMITTISKGVGKNRNIALQFASAEICLLGDDDMHYTDDYPEILAQAFNELPNADVIIFNIDTEGKTVKRRKNSKIKPVKIFNFQNYGTARIAFRRESIIRANIWFSLLFGGGSRYSSGEDSLFLRDALRKKIKIFTYPATIGTVDQTTSTWFVGYNEKYFFDKGAVLQAMFPILKNALAKFYFPLRLKTMTNLSAKEMRSCIAAGIKAYTQGINYEEWKASIQKK